MAGKSGKYSREELERVGEEMNDIMGLTPAMKFDTDNDTLYDTIVDEARGRGVVKDAIRADDFEVMPGKPEKRLFTKDALRFFVEAGVWDDKAKAVIMAPAPNERRAEKVPEKPAVERSTPVNRKAEKAEEKAQQEMEAGENEQPAAAAQGKPEPARKVKADKKDGKAAPAAPAGQAPEAKKEEPVKKTKAAAKKGAAKKTGGVAKNQGIGALTRELIAAHADKGNVEIAEMVNKKLGTDTKATSVAWHRNQMKAGKKKAGKKK